MLKLMEIKAGDFVKAIRESTGEFHSLVKVVWVAPNVISTSFGMFVTDTLRNTVNKDVLIVAVASEGVAAWCDGEVTDDIKKLADELGAVIDKCEENFEEIARNPDMTFDLLCRCHGTLSKVARGEVEE